MMEPVHIELTEEEKQQYRELFRPSDGQRRKEIGMKKAITLTGDAALAAQAMIVEARAKFPILSGATDEEVLTILVSYSLTREATG